MRALLIDVGGTLWPDAWPNRPEDRQEQMRRLLERVPGLAQEQASALVMALSVVHHPPTERQQTDVLIAQAVGAVRPNVVLSDAAVRNAMCLPPRGRVELFPGARELLRGAAEGGLRVIVVSNVLWRDVLAHRRDFKELGLSNYISDYVSSLDVGWRKPNPAFLDAAVSAAGCAPGDCVMVGDSETNDIVPAHARGMLAIRVAIAEPLPATTVADHVVDSLHAVAELLGLI